MVTFVLTVITALARSLHTPCSLRLVGSLDLDLVFQSR